MRGFGFRQREKRQGKKEVARQESKMLALIWVSSLREDRSAWIAFLAFNFSYTKRDWSWGAALDLSNQLPWQELLRYSTSRNERARQRGEVRYAQKVWQVRCKEAGEESAEQRQRKEGRGLPPSVRNYVWSPRCSRNAFKIQHFPIEQRHSA